MGTTPSIITSPTRSASPVTISGLIDRVAKKASATSAGTALRLAGLFLPRVRADFSAGALSLIGSS